ncbi:MAG: LacI family DNA-binding transcriptional regulator [Fusicatenibacter sp.]|nr:LacI family DNA-binding transcriptional regulator [Lachnospiraceae bacterium]MDY2939291.1 LacI family DNA-binding transcriptional regulator [Fusicatenibacter sp.]
MGKDLNIYTIAREAGVSVSTVSRVMTQSAKVSPEKKQRVEEVIQKYNYRPNALARGLSSTKTHMIGLLAADLENPYYSALITSCEKEINRRGYVPMISSFYMEDERERESLQKMSEMQVEAIVMLGGKSDSLINDPEYAELVNQVLESVPIVTTGFIEGTDCHQVTVDEGEATEMAIRHLISLGHRRIAMIGGFDHMKSTHEKRVRYREELKKYGIEYREGYVKDSNYSIEGGYQAMNEFFEENQMLPTAVIAINDFSAVGIIRSIKEHGYEIPEDIALVSFDNTFIAEAVIPKLTSLSYELNEYGTHLIDTVIGLIEGKEFPCVQKYSARLIVRESSGNPIGK